MPDDHCDRSPRGCSHLLRPAPWACARTHRPRKFSRCLQYRPPVPGRARKDRFPNIRRCPTIRYASSSNDQAPTDSYARSPASPQTVALRTRYLPVFILSEITPKLDGERRAGKPLQHMATRSLLVRRRAPRACGVIDCLQYLITNERPATGTQGQPCRRHDPVTTTYSFLPRCLEASSSRSLLVVSRHIALSPHMNITHVCAQLITGSGGEASPGGNAHEDLLSSLYSISCHAR